MGGAVGGGQDKRVRDAAFTITDFNHPQVRLNTKTFTNAVSALNL